MHYYSVVECLGKNISGHCGYCKRPSTCKEALGLWAYHLEVAQYNDLLDRGFRRSGCYLYKPINQTTCCPQYTIRLDAHKFKLSRSQKRVLRQMNEFLVHNVKPTRKSNEIDEAGSIKRVKSTTTGQSSQKTPKKKDDSSHPANPKITKLHANKKKAMRLERCFEKMRKKGIDVEEAKRNHVAKEEARCRTLESYILPYEPSHAHKLEVRLVDVDSDEMKERANESFDLYKKYQMTVHNDEVTFDGYKNFLVKTPLFDDSVLDDTYQDDDEFKLGTYHEQYLLDGKLIAVGVLDILPRTVSSKYVFYDPDYNFLTLGTYSALREIELTRKLSRTRPDLHYYYMGFYIHSCPKMRYKGRFRPSHLLCDRSYTWVPFESCKQLLDTNERVAAFAPDEPQADACAVNSVVCLYNRCVMSYHLLLREPSFKETKTYMEDYAKLMGPVAQKVCLYRSS